MNIEGLDEAGLNYWLAWVLGEPLETLRVEEDKCIRSNDTTVDYLNDPSILNLLLAKALFGKHPNDLVTFNGNADSGKRFTAEICRSEKQACKVFGPTPVIAACRAVVAFAYQYCRSG